MWKKQGNQPVFNGSFGSCCDDLAQAMSDKLTESFFRTEDNGVLYLTVGYVTTEQGPGFFDAAVLFCPFCGKRLQDETTIAKQASAA